MPSGTEACVFSIGYTNCSWKEGTRHQRQIGAGCFLDVWNNYPACSLFCMDFEPRYVVFRTSECRWLSWLAFFFSGGLLSLSSLCFLARNIVQLSIINEKTGKGLLGCTSGRETAHVSSILTLSTVTVNDAALEITRETVGASGPPSHCTADNSSALCISGMSNLWPSIYCWPSAPISSDSGQCSLLLERNTDVNFSFSFH